MIRRIQFFQPAETTLGFGPPIFDDFPPVGGGSPPINPPRTGGRNRIDWQSIINQGFAVTSQWLASRGRYPTAQMHGYQPTLYPGGQSGGGYDLYRQQQIEALQRQRQSGIAEDAFSGVTDFVSRYPLVIFGGIVALFLLFREPPRRR